MDDIRKKLMSDAKGLGIKITLEQAEKFQKYMEVLIEWNEKMNLTSIIIPEEIAEKHFIDSLTLLLACNPKLNGKFLDVGTGAGFPGIPIKIMRPDLNVTLLDGSNKRLNFLRELCGELDIECIYAHKRAEEAGLDKYMRENFDLVTARAVAQLRILCEYCLPLVKMKGLFIAMKGPGAGEELDEARNALKILGGDRVEMRQVKLPSAGERNLIVVRKFSYTPKNYPRHGGTILKHPL